MKKALITGIEGFTGRHLTTLLKTKGIKVTGIDVNPRTKYIQADLSNKTQVLAAITKLKPDYIFHLASPLIRSDQLIDASLEKNLEADLFGSVNLLMAASQLKKKPRILISGTAAVYKDSGSKLIKETFTLEPITAYGLSKLTQELVCRKLAESYQLPLIVTRTFLLIGPGQKPGFVVTDFAKQAAEIESGRQAAVLKTGNLETRRDFTDVRDAVQAYWVLMKKGKLGQVYNVCSGTSHSLKEAVRFFQNQSKREFRIKSEKKRWRRNDLKTVIGDNQKLKKLGWKPQIKFEQTLLDTLNYWRANSAKA
jgi:GDP-4-dehydro-6-deoxy-D-mannose reductase